MKKFIIAAGIAILLSGTSFDCTARTIYVVKRPPAVKVIVKPKRPFARAVWIPGYWAWRSKKFVWVSGFWTKPRPGHIWIPGHWVKKRQGWVWRAGHWKRI